MFKMINIKMNQKGLFMPGLYDPKAIEAAHSIFKVPVPCTLAKSIFFVKEELIFTLQRFKKELHEQQLRTTNMVL